jgi:hypothetical protein
MDPVLKWVYSNYIPERIARRLATLALITVLAKKYEAISYATLMKLDSFDVCGVTVEPINITRALVKIEKLGGVQIERVQTYGPPAAYYLNYERLREMTFTARHYVAFMDKFLSNHDVMDD